MRISVVSSSLNTNSRSKMLATMCQAALEDRGISVDFIDLRQFDPPNFDDDDIYSSEVYLSCHRVIAAADAVILASPVYNWACCSELKKFVEYIGSTPQDGSLRGAFYDKIVMFVNAGRLQRWQHPLCWISSVLSARITCMFTMPIGLRKMNSTTRGWRD